MRSTAPVSPLPLIETPNSSVLALVCPSPNKATYSVHGEPSKRSKSALKSSFCHEESCNFLGVFGETCRPLLQIYFDTSIEQQHFGAAGGIV